MHATRSSNGLQRSVGVASVHGPSAFLADPCLAAAGSQPRCAVGLTQDAGVAVIHAIEPHLLRTASRLVSMATNAPPPWW